MNDITAEISCNKLLFADDLKLFTEIKSINDCQFLKNNLESVMKWCGRNRLHLNKDKCSMVSYSRKKRIIEYDYIIDGVTISRVDKIRDLGVLFDSKLSFKEHILDIASKSLKIYGFIYRNCREFRNIETLRMLYIACIRSKLEYASLIWDPLYITYIHILEKVQRKCLKFLAFIADGNYPPRDCDHSLLLDRFLLNSLETRRFIVSIKFLFCLLKGKIDSSYLVGKIFFIVPRVNSRCSLTFYVSTCRTNILYKAPVQNICNKFNLICRQCDINADPLQIISKCIIDVVGI